MSRILLTTIKQALPQWNERQLTDDVFYETLEQRGIVVVYSPQICRAEYVHTDSQTIVAINSDLRGYEMLEAQWHEAAHHLLHHPAPQCFAGGRSKEETEAEIVALCAIVPRAWLDSRTIDEMIVEGIPRDLLRRRAKIMAEFGV